MHRVELKGIPQGQGHPLEALVPNAPCGVESSMFSENEFEINSVPNAPCGVERAFGCSDYK